VNSLARVSGEERDRIGVARVDGEIDASNAAWVGARLRALVSNRSDALVVDLTATGYLDSAGIALLFTLASDLQLHQQKLHLVVAGGSGVARMVSLTGLDRAAPAHESLDAALQAAAPAPAEPEAPAADRPDPDAVSRSD
jgi:anti-anti-sigma factor